MREQRTTYNPMISVNIECGNNSVLSLNDLTSGDLELTIAHRQQTRPWFSGLRFFPGVSPSETIIVPKNRRCLIASYIIGNESHETPT